MARPPLPATGATGWQDILNAAIDDVSDRADSALAQVGSGIPGTAALDSFTGSSDDAKLTAAMSYAASQTYPPAIRLANRLHQFSTARTLYSGFRLAGPGQGASNAEKSAAMMPCQVQITSGGQWLNLTGGDVWDAFIGGGIAFIGTSSTTFMGSTDGSCWHCSQIRDVSWNNFLSVMGTQATKLSLIASIIDGWIAVNGMYSGAFHLAGTDSRLFTNGGLFDSPAGYAPSGASQYHLWFDWLDYSTIGPIYITAEAKWGGIRVTGPGYNASNQASSSNTGALSMQGAVVMGRNNNAPCYGSLIRVEGGSFKVRDSLITFGMSNPTSAAHSPVDGGSVMVTGGAALLDGCTYDRYTGQAESVPYVYTSSNGPVRVSNTFLNSRGGVWTGLPQVHNAGTGTFKTDDTVTVA